MTPSGPKFDGERLLAELGWMRALARHLVADPGLAEDVVQEAWVLARERPPRTDSTHGMRAWLARVTRSLVRSQRRGARVRARHEHAAARADLAPAAAEVLARTQAQQGVVAAVMALEEPYRSAVLLRHVEGYSARRIAALQGTSEANARQRTARGLAQLRRMLDREHGGDGRGWVLALAPFLRPAGPVAGATILLGGTVFMKKILAAGAVVVLAVLGAFLARQRLEAGGGRIEPGRSASKVRLASPESGAARSLLVAAEDLPTRVPAAPGNAPPPRHVRARILGLRGEPLTGAELHWLADPARLVRADARGFVELTLPNAGPRVGAELEIAARAPGHGELRRAEFLPRHGDLELGELRLIPIGTLSGVVRDENGRPLAGADVRLALPPLGLDSSSRLDGPPYTVGQRRVLAGAEGRFLFEEVRAGTWRPWAGAPGLAWGHGEVLSIEPDTPCSEIELVLVPLPPENLIRGRVIDARGAALPGMHVYAAGEQAQQPSAYCVSNTAGAFVLNVAAGVPQRVTAQQEPFAGENARAPEFGPASRVGVLGGEEALLLVLRPARWLAVSLVDPSGMPLAGSLTVSHDNALADFVPAEDGSARVLVSDQPFTLVARAAKHAPETRGPMDPAQVLAPLRIELRLLACVRGRVRANGELLPGAVVQLVKPASPGEVSYLYGFPARLDGEGLEGCLADANGRFELPIRRPGTHVLFSEAEGYAAWESAPFELGREDVELDVTLDAGGTVTGHVLVPRGESPAGVEVRLSRGDMRVHEAVADAEGFYRIERLAPGPYMVLAERTRSSARRGGGSALGIERVTRASHEFSWRLEVRSGETTRFDVDLLALAPARLEGRFLVDGRPQTAAAARLLPRSEPWRARPFSAGEHSLAADGSFRFEGRRPEPVWLVLESSGGVLEGTTIVVELELEPGENRRDLALERGSVRGTLPANEPGPFVLLTEPTPGLCTLTPVEGPAGEFLLQDVPAAAVVRLLVRPDGNDASDPRGWRALARGRVPAGGEGRLE